MLLSKQYWIIYVYYCDSVMLTNTMNLTQNPWSPLWNELANFLVTHKRKIQRKSDPFDPDMHIYAY